MTATRLVTRVICGERLRKLSGTAPEWSATINGKPATFKRVFWHEPVIGTNQKRKVKLWHWSFENIGGHCETLTDAVRQAQRTAHRAGVE